jgi:MFS family permease
MREETNDRRTNAAPRTTAAQVVRAYLVISALFTLSASIIWGVNTLFLLNAGLDIFEVFIANAAFAAGMVIFEIPTGIIADASGRRRSFLLSAATLSVGTLGYVAAAASGGGLGLFVIASLVLGLGFCFYSGAVEAWLVDALVASGSDEQLDRVFGRGAMVSGVAEIAGSIAGGLLASVSLFWPFLLRTGLLAAVFVVGLLAMHDIGFTRRATTLAEVPTEVKKVVQASVKFGWQSRPVRLFMIVSFVQGAFLMWGFYAWQPYFLELLGEVDPSIAGVIASFVALSTIAGNGLVGFFTRYCGRRTTLLAASAGILAVAVIGVGLVDSFWPAVGFFLLAMAATGLGTPVQHAYLHAVIPSAQRATVISAVSLVASAGGSGGSVGLGYLSRTHSVAAGYLTAGFLLLLALPPLLVLRNLRENADRIVGRNAGRPGPCAGQGLPQVSSLDTTTRQPWSHGDASETKAAQGAH